MRTSIPKQTGPTQRSNSQRGNRGHNSFTEDHSPHVHENFELSNKGFRNTHIIGKSNNNNTGYGPKPTKLTDKRYKDKDYDNQDEHELSSLSGFTASDNEEHDDHEDMKFKMLPKSNKKIQQDSSDEEENLDQVHHDIVLNPRDDLKARFEQLKRKNDEERREREVLGEHVTSNTQNVPLKRPNTAHGAMRGSENQENMNANMRTFVQRQKENNYLERPQTANVANMRLQEGECEKPITFKPVYTKSIQQSLMDKKAYNYADKKFKTLKKKSDPVSRFNSFKTEWNKTKFLKNNPKMTEGRKLNLSERNQTSKPEFVFHKYQPKYVFDV